MNQNFVKKRGKKIYKQKIKLNIQRCFTKYFYFKFG